MVASMKDINAAELQFIGILNQEAHAKDVWPIGAGERLSNNATFSIEERVAAAHRMLDTLPQLNVLRWFVDRPNESFYHVGGDFNDRFGAWPHKYFVFDRDGRLLFRSSFHFAGPRQHFINFNDLPRFLETLPFCVKPEKRQ